MLSLIAIALVRSLRRSGLPRRRLCPHSTAPSPTLVSVCNSIVDRRRVNRCHAEITTVDVSFILNLNEWTQEIYSLCGSWWLALQSVINARLCRHCALSAKDISLEPLPLATHAHVNSTLAVLHITLPKDKQVRVANSFVLSLNCIRCFILSYYYCCTITILLC